MLASQLNLILFREACRRIKGCGSRSPSKQVLLHEPSGHITTLRARIAESYQFLMRRMADKVFASVFCYRLLSCM